MTVSTSSTGLPPARADDDDDVAWALQTAQVQWQRGAHADAVVWLRRAVEAARSIGAVARALELERATHSIVQRLMEVPYHSSRPDEEVEEETSDVDDLLDEVDDGDAMMESAEAVSIDDDVEEVQAEDYAESEELETAQFALGHQPSFEEVDDLDLEEEPVEEIVEDVSEPIEPYQVERANLIDIGLAPGEGLDERTSVDDPREVDDFDELDLDYEDEENPTRPARSADAAISFSSEVTPMSKGRAQVVSSTPPLSPAAERAEALRGARVRVAQAAQRAAQFAVSRPSPVPQSKPEAVEVEAEPESLSGADLSVDEERSPSSAPSIEVPDSVPPPPPVASVQPSESPPSIEVPDSVPPPDARIDDVVLAEVHGLEDLPPEAQFELAHKARRRVLDAEEEVGAFALALVLCGSATVMPTIADVVCAHVPARSVVFSRGHLAGGVALRLVASEDGTEIALWSSEALDEAVQDCPWVADELRTIADRYQALAGLAMGPLGERLDDMMRSMVTDRCEVRLLLPGEEIVTRDKPIPGLFIVGAGTIEIFGDDDAQAKFSLGPGDFVLPEHVLGGGKAQSAARASQGGALVLFIARMSAHELLVSVPPLLEVLAS